MNLHRNEEFENYTILFQSAVQKFTLKPTLTVVGLFYTYVIRINFSQFLSERFS